MGLHFGMWRSACCLKVQVVALSALMSAKPNNLHNIMEWMGGLFETWCGAVYCRVQWNDGGEEAGITGFNPGEPAVDA